MVGKNGVHQEHSMHRKFGSGVVRVVKHKNPNNVPHSISNVLLQS